MSRPAEKIIEEVLSPQEERINQGQPFRLGSAESQTKRIKINKMLERFREQPIRINVERALLFTESFQQTEGEPIVLRWSKALAHILRNMSIHIEEDELIAGSAGPPGRYSVAYPELGGRFVTGARELMPSAPGDKAIVTEQDVKAIQEKLLPYWEDKNYSLAYFKALPEDTRSIIEKMFIITPTATGRHMLAWAHDFDKVLKKGFKGIKEEAKKKMESLDSLDPKDNIEKKPFLESVIIVCDAVKDFAKRYASLARQMAETEADENRKNELLEISDICEWVPENPARTFHEAVQSQWLTQVVSRLEQRIGGTVSNGRMDQYFYPYYKKDIEEGRITEDDALALLESMWVGMSKCVDFVTTPGSISFVEGYAHWEALTIGGQTKDGKDATNELSHLILKSKREFPLNYPDLSARIHSQTPDSFLHAVCETIKEGTGFPKLFFDEEIIPLLISKGGEVEEANDYCIAGCTEVKMVNKDAVATGCAWINLGAIVEMTLNDGKLKEFDSQRLGVSTGDPRSFTSYEDLWDAFRRQAEHILKHTFVQQYVADTLKSSYIAAPMCSMLHDLCLDDCKDIHSGPVKNAVYLGFFDTMGFGTAIDSLAAIKNLVFESKRLTMDEILNAIDTNFEGKEAIRQMCLNAPKYGNSDPSVDSIGHDIEELFASTTHKYKTAFGGELDVRYVTITSHVPLGAVVGATPDGRKAKEPLSEGIGPSPGADKKGPTATLTSIAKTRCGAYKERAARLLNMKFSPATVAGPAGTRKLMSLIRTACDLKMWHLQFNIINRETLIAAQKNPEKYQDLLVRVAGYSAYFVDLTPQLQNEIIKRTEHNF
jgi:formate C-acetyltransferase